MSDGRQIFGAARAIEAQAATFLERRRLSRWTASDQNEFEVWLGQSTAHRVAYLRLVDGEALIERVSDREPKELRVLTPSSGRMRWGFFAIAASLVLVLIGGVVANSILTPPPDRSYATGVGGLALIKFGDNTAIEINTDSAIRYRMTTAERTVWLERGEVYFRVAHSKTLPFSVIAGGHRITDLGTEFLVRESGRDLDVLLVKGRAQLSSENRDNPVATLMPGDEAVASHGTTMIEKRSIQEVSDAVAWRKGVVVFRRIPLVDAVREFNRYNQTKLIVADRAIANLKFSAELKTDDFRDFIELAQVVYGLRAEQRGGDIYLYGDAKRDRHSKSRR